MFSTLLIIAQFPAVGNGQPFALHPRSFNSLAGQKVGWNYVLQPQTTEEHKDFLLVLVCRSRKTRNVVEATPSSKNIYSSELLSTISQHAPV